jgi:hypothetical protein
MVTLWNFDICGKFKVKGMCAIGNYAYEWIINCVDTTFSYVLETQTLKQASKETLLY